MIDGKDFMDYISMGVSDMTLGINSYLRMMHSMENIAPWDRSTLLGDNVTPLWGERVSSVVSPYNEKVDILSGVHSGEEDGVITYFYVYLDALGYWIKSLHMYAPTPTNTTLQRANARTSWDDTREVGIVPAASLPAPVRRSRMYAMLTQGAAMFITVEDAYRVTTMLSMPEKISYGFRSGKRVSASNLPRYKSQSRRGWLSVVSEAIVTDSFFRMR